MISVLFLFRVSICLTLSRRVLLVQQELLSLPEHMSSPPVFSGVRVDQSLAFCRSLFVLLSFLFWSLFCLPFVE